jgi:hypothetical protein
MPALLPIILIASHIALAADTVPKFDVERTCRPAAVAGVLPGRDSSACQRDENEARSKLEQDWTSTLPGNAASALALPDSIAHRAMLNC